MRRFRSWPNSTACIRTRFYAWKKQVLDNVASLFARGASGFGRLDEEEREREAAKLYAKIGQLTVERISWPRGPGDDARPIAERWLNGRGKDLSVRRQCALLNLARFGSLPPQARRGGGRLGLDAPHRRTPSSNCRSMARGGWMFELKKEGRGVNRKRGAAADARDGHRRALVPRPGTSKAAPGHKIYPYLLRGLAIAEPNHVWAADITYIPMARGFLYLVAIMDWASRAVLAWRLSNTIDAGFCVEALEEALLRHGMPKIFNTDQGAQFTSAAFTGKLEAAGIAISMDGRGRFMDNIFIERLWRSIKYEEIHLKAYADGREARAGISSWMTFYNFRRPHQALDNQMPMAVWQEGIDKIEAAAEGCDMSLRLDNANALPTYPQQKAEAAGSGLIFF